MVESNEVQLVGDITKESEEMQIEALKELEELKMYGEENIISAVIPHQTTAPSVCFIAADQAGIYRRKDDRQQKCQDAREFHETVKKGCLALNLHVWNDTINGLDRLYER